MTNAAQKITDLNSFEQNYPIILQYFQSINQSNFQAAAALFSEIGVLHAPFESPIQGKEAIAKYLTDEAKGMTLIPHQVETIEPQMFLVRGQVKTSLFSVNVGWQFCLENLNQIASLRVKLLASPQELLNLRQHRQ